jgi:release factor glutamine methyltransferase
MAEEPPSETDAATASERLDNKYQAHFEDGHCFNLYDRPGTFHVSPAGLALGNYLIRNLREDDIAGSVLDVGTGSGAIAFVLRNLGASSIAATDICASAVKTAEDNELANFSDSVIDFRHCDLFPDPELMQHKGYDLVVFNPPGWRAPSEALKKELSANGHTLDLKAMFYGDKIILRFLQRLPMYLAENGRAIVGFNSLVGIEDVIERARSTSGTRAGYELRTRLLQRIELPLMFYTDEWRAVGDSLLDQFERGRREYAATYMTRGDTIYWYYDITEATIEATTDPARPSPVAEGASKA